jgi:hypothetical protein
VALSSSFTGSPIHPPPPLCALSHRPSPATFGILVGLREVRYVFETMPFRNIIVWTSMVFSYYNNQMLNINRSLANTISGGNLCTSTILMSGYAAASACETLGGCSMKWRVCDTQRVFDELACA